MYDLNNNPISAGQISCTGSDQTLLSIKADCRTGYVLRAEADDLQIEAKHTDGDEWTNLIADSLALDDWHGSRETFEIRISGESVTSRQMTEARLIVEPV